MSIIDRARDALDKATPGPWLVEHNGSHDVIAAANGWAVAYNEDGPELPPNSPLLALSPELAAAVDRVAKFADELEADAVRVGVSGTVATDETKIELAARIRQALEGEKE